MGWITRVMFCLGYPASRELNIMQLSQVKSYLLGSSAGLKVIHKAIQLS